MKSDSNCQVTSGPRGQKVVRSFGRDDSSADVGSNEMSMNGAKMGGGVSNLGHSVSGASAVQHVKGE